MQEWDYNELSEYVNEVFSNSISDGLNALQAGGRCLYEFANVIEEGETEKIIFYITLAFLQIEKGVLSQRIYDEVKSITREFDIDKFVSELGFDDAKDLSKRVKSVEAKFHIVEVIS
ncbi:MULTISPECIES: Imm3 family immunity protein [unclassified Paenibacillus]|uniref:Imm3 family immunity protein n=1 Tax=unclassified Paenibacillus TaxID=185978 RepID=UPI0020B700FA|nr:Imm3 family immunity protein [Paenibacillus sp. MZ03-122A]MCP3780902.1 Imm3 family immunity protein [Paenibacillus sp. MZ03-122A]